MPLFSSRSMSWGASSIPLVKILGARLACQSSAAASTREGSKNQPRPKTTMASTGLPESRGRRGANPSANKNTNIEKLAEIINRNKNSFGLLGQRMRCGLFRIHQVVKTARSSSNVISSGLLSHTIDHESLYTSIFFSSLEHKLESNILNILEINYFYAILNPCLNSFSIRFVSNWIFYKTL